MCNNIHMKLRGFLKEIFVGNNIQLLLFFYRFKLGQFSGRDISQKTNLNHKVCLNILNKFVDLKLINKQIIGKAHVFSYRDNIYWNNLFFPLFNAEYEILKIIKEEIINLFASYCYKIIIFGSYARNEETVDSDLDVCFVSNGAQKNLKEKIEAFEETFHDKYLCHFSPYIISKSVYNQGKLDIIKDIKNEGNIIYGR